MKLSFSKYEGTGNDFIIIDNRSGQAKVLGTSIIEKLCHRKTGIGADGLILLENASGFDFRMVYYNADGKESTLCGNGGRCIAAFAMSKGIVGIHSRFLAIDGPHEAEIRTAGLHRYRVKLQMKNTSIPTENASALVFDTGSPHIVIATENLMKTDVFNRGREIRNSDKFVREGINVNFAEVIDKKVFVRTYERGVEDETLSCGTGVTAAAMAASCWGWVNECPVMIGTPGGDLSVTFEKGDGLFTQVYLEGPVSCTFTGEFETESFQ